MENKICCGNFEKMVTAFGWFKLNPESILLMPYLEVNGIKWRINNCPSCGANVREVKLNYQTLEKQS